jgi:hypothetical protein
MPVCAPIKCGIANAECGIKAVKIIPHSEIRIPHSYYFANSTYLLSRTTVTFI